jgi:transposase
MRPHGSAKTLEHRRRRAVDLLASGLTMEEVSHRVGCSKASVCRWRQALAQGGAKALTAKPVPGRPRKLLEEDCRQLLAVLLQGAVAYGYPNELWTLDRIAEVIQREFGVDYHPHHVWRLLRQHSWSCQVPEWRAIQRDEAAIAHWKRYRWPHIKKGSRTWGPSGLPG